MASAITLEGIDQSISNLKYKNKNTLKYRFVQHIRQYYTSENSVVFLNEIDHEELIKMLWDTDHSFEAIKNKRKNLNGVRSSVNADLKKLYEKGGNPEGIKIGSKNIFVMSEDAKDKILKKVGHDLQPDGTLKLDQIMDILKLANETVSGSMAVEDKEKKDGLKKIDRLKDLIKGLSEKVGLGSPELLKTVPEAAEMADRGDEEGPGSMEMAEVLDEEPLDEADEVEEIADLEEEVEYIEGGAEDDILDDIEDVEIDEIADTDTDDLVETAEIDEELEDVSDEEDAELGYVEDVEDVEEIIGDDISEEQAGESGPGDEDTLEGIGLGQDSGQEKTGIDIGGDETLSKDGGAGLEDGDKEDGEGVGHDMAGKGDEEGPGSMEMAEVLDDSELDTVEAVEDIEDLEDEVEYIEGSDAEAGDLTGTAEHRFEEEEGKRENEQLGLPVDSLGKEYSIEADSKIKKSKLLAEEFDGYLGSMDRHYNHYILIPEGEYLIGSKQPKKDEKPEQMVYLKPIYFSRFPITNGLFEIFVEKTGYKTTAEKVGYGTVYFGRFEKKKDEITGLITSTWNSSLYCKTVEGACWYQPSGPKSTLYNKRNHPVVQISMEDAMAFASWTGKRLPTENEWEAASRTVNGWIFPWGQEWKKDACNIEDSCTADTTPVDKYSEFENDFGIVDTIGNVLEWTDNSFEEMSKTNNGAKYRAVRGGSWISGNDIRLFSRFMIEPESHSNILGFRCVAY
jgi:formylglycine-generating enzyme required for sulfatase activity